MRRLDQIGSPWLLASDIAGQKWQSGGLERVRGIEPLYAAWEAAVLPLNYTREGVTCTLRQRVIGKPR